MSAAVGDPEAGTKWAAKVDKRFMAVDMMGRRRVVYVQRRVLFWRVDDAGRS